MPGQLLGVLDHALLPAQDLGLALQLACCGTGYQKPAQLRLHANVSTDESQHVTRLVIF